LQLKRIAFIEKLEKIESMESKLKIELAVKIIAPFIMLIGILIGVWQFNEGQRNLQQKELIQRNFELKKCL